MKRERNGTIWSWRSAWLVAMVWGVLLAGTEGALAQTRDYAPDDLPAVFDEGPVERWMTEDDRLHSPFHRRRLQDTYADALARGEVAEVAASMVEDFRGLVWGENEPTRELILRHLDVFLADLAAAMRDPRIDGPLDTAEEQGAFLEALLATGRGVSTLRLGSLADGTPVYFKGRSPDPAQWLPLYEYVEGEDADVFRVSLTEKQMRAWRLLENALTDLLDKQNMRLRAKNVESLERAVVRWENYLDHGYSQYPWESLLNGYLIETPELGPPDRQWIVGHPALGVELSIDNPRESRLKEALNLEVLGHLWYRGDEFDDYWGASLALSFREDVDPGVGFLVHIKRNWNLGVMWHDTARDPYLFFSIDLFRFAAQKRKDYVARYEDLKSRLGR